MSASRFVMTHRALCLFIGAALLVVFSAVNVCEAKKPPKDPPATDPDPPPVQYHVTWLPGLADNFGYPTVALDINSEGIIVGRSDGHAVYWDSSYGVHNLNAVETVPGDVHLYKASHINETGLIVGGYEDLITGRLGIYAYDRNDGELYLSTSYDIGGVYPRGVNADGSVVGYFRRSDNSFVGFAWHYDLDDVHFLPEQYFPTDINDLGDVVGYVDDRSMALFSWQLDWLALTDPASTAVTLGISTTRSPGAVINNAGTIVADSRLRPKPGPCVLYLSPEADEWDIVIGGEVTTRLGINNQNQVCGATSRLRVDPDPGFVFLGDTFWRLDNDQIVEDPTNLWFTDNSVPEAIADVSSPDEFGVVVGWHYVGGAFVLIPQEPPPTQ